jgi:hypothetical protein
MKGKKSEMKFMGQEGLCAKKEAFHFIQYAPIFAGPETASFLDHVFGH